MSNIDQLLSSLPDLLSPSSELATPQDALTALVHTVMSALAFRLVSVDDSSSASSATSPDNVLPDGWNRHGPAYYALRYSHGQSSLKFIIKVIKMDRRTLICGIVAESDEVVSMDVSTAEFVSATFPRSVGPSGQSRLSDGFTNRVATFVSQFKMKIVQKFMPDLVKEGLSEASTSSTANARPAQPYQDHRPPPQEYRPPPRSDWPPEQPLGIPSPAEIGRSDLDPFPNPLRPQSLFPQNSGDGMYVGPNHPVFGGAFGDRRGSRDPPTGPWGGDGFLPPIGAPPGARFDPVGPFGRRGGPLGGGSPFGGGMGRGSGFGRGMPDPDMEPRPDGSDDMFS